MTSSVYQKQVTLLLRLLPCVAIVPEFVLKGGTAINMFERNMPRLSIDIDLVWKPLSLREQAMSDIARALGVVSEHIVSVIPDAKVFKKLSENDEVRLYIQHDQVEVKIEVNKVGRGCVWPPRLMPLHIGVQQTMRQFAEIMLVSRAELFGGKLCAALDRQHPRDLFDVKILLDEDGWDDSIQDGLVVALLGHNRPIHEVLNPQPKDTLQAFENQFNGMALIPFSYSDAIETFGRMKERVLANLSDNHKELLCSVASCNPRWELFSAPQIENMPAIKWKLMNLKTLQQIDPVRFRMQRTELEKIFGL